MKVRIICKENVHSWILGKFALKMQSCLKELGVNCEIGTEPDETADINHNIIYYEYDGRSEGVNTMMITHIDEFGKLQMIRDSLKTSSMGICMSNQMMHWLGSMGVDKTKLSYVDPAHDGCALIKKYVIGIASRVYSDGRKREYFFERFAKDLDPRIFEFKFMGAGWEKQVEILKDNGFSVAYFNEFVRKEYYKFIQSLDYYLYTGTDEGQMGFVDAAAAGVPSIVTPQGYHLDAPEALTYPFWEYDDLVKILLDLQTKKLKLINSVETWTWMDYTKKHLEIWKYLLGESCDSKYKDGLNAHLDFVNDETAGIKNKDFILQEEARLLEIDKLHANNKEKNVSTPVNNPFITRIYRAIRRRIKILFVKN